MPGGSVSSIQVVNDRKCTGVKTTIQTKGKYFGTLVRRAVGRKFSDCQNIEPVQTLQGCHTQEQRNGLHRALSLAIALKVEL